MQMTMHGPLMFGAAVVVALASVSDAKKISLPKNHPLVDFAPHLRCPYAEQWLTKGPEQAARDLGLLKNDANKMFDQHRKLEEEPAGSCSYVSQWSGAHPACFEMRESWSTEAMEQKCAEMSGTVSQGTLCELPPALAGWCIQENAAGQITTHPFALSDSMTCAAMKSTCQDMMQGTFEPSGECQEGSTTDMATCEIAPGPIGAAHQAAYSGYRANCPGTPGEGSPYMWPLQWSADAMAEGMEFGSDEIKFTSRNRVYYHLDKNYKRSDTWYQRGVQRSLGQGPCPEEDRITDDEEGRINVCKRNSDDLQTMLHRGGKMIFITWQNGTSIDMTTNVSRIETCRWMDLKVIGNVRPDWFMDDRGDSTDTQYLGDQHVYHEGVPRLVKQWRKTDFANQYFTMSMLGNPGEDGQHWPMILNIPGEGFGDDFLQIYSNHTLLTEDDVDLFLLEEQYEAMGGSCPQMEMVGEAANGPPTGGVHIPSNLEIDPNAWFSNVYTFSPVWEPPTTDAVTDGMSSAGSGVALTESGSTITASCYDQDTSSVQLTVTFKGVAADATTVAEVPWMALSKRETDECLMTPRGGGDAPTIFVMNDAMPGEEGGKLTALHGLLGPGAKNFGSGASGVTAIYSTLKPLEEMDGYSDVSVSVAGAGEDRTVSAQSSTSQTLPSELRANAGDVQLSFKLSVGEGVAPEVLHLNYAIGNTPALGYHTSRECYSVKSFPPCKSPSSVTEEGDVVTKPATKDDKETAGSVRGTNSGASSFESSTAAMMAGSVVILMKAGFV